MKIEKKQAGVTLVEVLITVVVLAIGLLGMAALQGVSVKLSYESYLRTQASILSYDLIDRIRANSGERYLLDISEKPAKVECYGVAADCDARELMRADLYAWYTNASELFPNAQFELKESNNDYTLRISWDDRYDNDDKDGEAPQFIFNFEGY